MYRHAQTRKYREKQSSSRDVPLQLSQLGDPPMPLPPGQLARLKAVSVEPLLSVSGLFLRVSDTVSQIAPETATEQSILENQT